MNQMGVISGKFSSALDVSEKMPLFEHSAIPLLTLVLCSNAIKKGFARPSSLNSVKVQGQDIQK